MRLTFKKREDELIWTYHQIISKKRLVYLSMFFKFYATTDFGYNMFDYSDIDIKKSVMTTSFIVKFVTLFLMIILVYVVYFKDKKLLADYFLNEDTIIRKGLGESQ